MKSRVVRANEGSTKLAPAGQICRSGIAGPGVRAGRPFAAAGDARHLHAGWADNWHTHAVGQILYVLSGAGRYQREGEAVQEILPGDTVIIPANARHWHGAAPDRMMCHLALSESDDSGAAAEWLEPVSDADYTAAAA